MVVQSKVMLVTPVNGECSNGNTIWKHRSRDHSDCWDWCHSHSGAMDRANRKSLTKCVVKAKLSDDSLLYMCMHDGTQHSYEGFHHLIWQRCPKVVVCW